MPHPCPTFSKITMLPHQTQTQIQIHTMLPSSTTWFADWIIKVEVETFIFWNENIVKV